MQGLCLWDTLGCDISPYFGPGSQFINIGLSGGGKVLVHCQMGVSRYIILFESGLHYVKVKHKGAVCFLPFREGFGAYWCQWLAGSA